MTKDYPPQHGHFLSPYDKSPATEILPLFHSPPINKSPQLESARERAQLSPFLFTLGVLILVFTVGGTTVILNSAAVSAAVLQRPVLAGPVSGSLAAAPAAFLPRYFGGNPAR